MSLAATARVSAQPRSPLPARAPATAFVNVAVIPMDSERVLTGQTVLVQGGRVTALGPVGQVRIPAGAVQVDGLGKFLIPGLADMHAHLQFADSLGDERILLLLLAHGVTTIRNVDFVPDTNYHLRDGRLLRLRARSAAGELLGPRIYTSGPWFGGTTARPRDAARAISAYKAAGYDFIKIHNENAETLDSVAAAARRVGLPIVGHIPGDVPLDRALKYYKSIEHLMGYAQPVIDALKDEVDSVTMDTMTIPVLTTMVADTRRAGVWNCPTQAIAEWLAANGATINGDGGGAWRAPDVLLLRRRIIKALQDGGAGLLLGTDEMVGHGESFLENVPNPSVQDELEALVRSGLTPYQALATGTRNVAVYFGTLNESGTVSVGKRADLVLLDGNPLQDIQQTEHVAGVMLGGRWLSRGDLDKSVADTTLGSLGIPK